MLSFHLYINGILIIVPIDNWCHPRWRRSILGMCRSKGLNYVLTFWLTPFLKSFEDMSFFSNSFFGLDLSDWRLESSKSFLSSNSTLWLWDYFYILVIILHFLQLLFQQPLSWAWGVFDSFIFIKVFEIFFFFSATPLSGLGRLAASLLTAATHRFSGYCCEDAKIRLLMIVMTHRLLFSQC